MRAFLSEWTKLGRRNMLLGFGGAMVGFTLLLTVLMFANTGGATIGMGGGDSGPASFATDVMLSANDGAVVAITQASTFLGIIALALFASSVAGEFTKGTIRMLFVTEPNRLKVWGGKLTALVSFTAIWVTVALLASIGVGAALAPGSGIETAAWWTSEGLAATGTAYLSIMGGVIMAGLLGATAAVLTRSSAIAISVGAAYFMIVEPLVGSFWDPLGEWGPAAVFGALARGGSEAIAYSTAATMVAAYGIGAAAIAGAILNRRDITS